MSSAPSGPTSDVEDEIGSLTGNEAPPPKPPTFPPYPSFAAKTAPPSVADAIVAGRGLRLQHKSTPMAPVRPLPRPAKPRGPKATDVKSSRRAMRLHARCLRKHGAVLTDRLERMARPPRRRIIYLWREQADRLPAETIARLRSMLDADEPFKPDQAYEYFINMRKTKKNAKKQRLTAQVKKDVQAICGDKRFVWARNATVAFARGIQQRLGRGGRCFLQDGMLKLSDILLDEFCGFMKMRTPSRRSNNPKAKFMMEMSDKVAIWIDGVLSESDERMLMMDFDEDDEVQRAVGGDGSPSYLGSDRSSMASTKSAVTSGASGSHQHSEHPPSDASAPPPGAPTPPPGAPTPPTGAPMPPPGAPTLPGAPTPPAAPTPPNPPQPPPK